MSARDVGDRVAIRHEVRDPDGALTNATVVVAVTQPDGTTLTPAPTVTNTSTGVYDASFTLDAAGLWVWVWAVSGAVVDQATGRVLAEDPTVQIYASVADLRKRLGIPATDGADDDRLMSALGSASREIDRHCGRGFWPRTVVSARVFRPARWDLAWVDDFWTTTGLIVETDEGDDGTYETTWVATDYELEPLNGVVDGEQGWPYCRIRAVESRYFPCTRRAALRVTAKWGWSSVPDPVHEACLILAEETAKLADAPFGVGGYSQFGIIRVRDNPMAARKLQPYRRNPVLVA